MLYKYVGARNGADAVDLLKCYVDKNTVKASDPASFNDPFEFKVVLNYDADEPTKRAQYFQGNPSSSELDYKNWRGGLEQARWWDTQVTRNNILSKYGVLCLSEMGDNQLMWSHYASNHKGFCVGLDENQLTALPSVEGYGLVDYQHEAPVFRFFHDDKEEFDRRALACKSQSWAYEKEYRILFKCSGFFEIPSSAIQEILLGCRAFHELRQFAHERCTSAGNFWIQMCEDLSAYRLLKRPIEKNVRVMSSFF